MRAPPIRSWKGPAALSVSDSLVGDDPTPPAALPLLLGADGWPVHVGAGLYAGAGWATECNNVAAGMNLRRVAVVVPLACRYSRAWVTRCGNADPLQPAQQLDHKHASPGGGGYAGNAISVANSPVEGAELYLQTDPLLAMTDLAVVPTGTTINDAPTAHLDRALALTPALAAAVAVYEVQNMVGLAFQFFDRTADLETL